MKGSAENLNDHKIHDVVGEGEQAEIAALTVVGAIALPNRLALVSLDIARHRQQVLVAVIKNDLKRPW